VYEGKDITIYRNGRQVAEYAADHAEKFGDDSFAVLGLRHLAAQPKETAYFTGTIEDARIYDRALAAETVAALEPNRASDPKPAAWWDFENG
ncbi:MAG: LamG domain-containing protein, partial [Akkermansiaceae bacterium]|nr:LamG domain-containing protein [Akkermansiaceae bacterium]